MDLTPYRRTERLAVDAPAEVIYDLVADIGRMGEWSPVCTGGEYDEDGAWFTGHNAVGTITWSTRCRVVAADPGREFAFVNCGEDGAFELVRWGFELRPASPTTTEVVQHWEVLPAYPDGFAAEGPDRGELADRLDMMKAMAESGMPTTLENIKQAAEQATLPDLTAATKGTTMSDQATETAVLAGGCFWGMQDLIRKRPGVLSTRVGYTGGDVPNATYRNHEGHAEAIEITYDPDQVSYRDLLEFFFQVHDPTTKDRQGNDIGTSYRSAIFTTSDAQRAVADETIEDVDASGLWPGKVLTEVTPAGPFWEAEPEHQDYLERYPNGYTCHFVREGWKLPHRAERA